MGTPINQILHMTANAQLDDNPKSKERIFFLCEECLWSATLLDKSHLEEIVGRDSLCPMCRQGDLTSFPLVLNESFTYDYSENRGIDIKFGRQNKVQ